MDNPYAERPCQACRQKRVKCDKRLSGCQRCLDSGQPCLGYKTARKFVDQSDEIRRKFVRREETNRLRLHSPAFPDFSTDSLPTFGLQSEPLEMSLPTEASPQQPANSLNARQICRLSNTTSPAPVAIEPSERKQQPVQSVSDVTNVNLLSGGSTNSFPVTPLYIAEPSPQPLAPYKAAEVIRLSNAHSNAGLSNSVKYQDSEFFDLDIESYYANGNNTCGFIPGVPVILGEADDLELDELDHHSLTTTAPELIVASQARGSGRHNAEAIAKRRQEMVLLTRFFVDFMAPWMDLFDFDAYFTRIIPLKAATNVMLQAALAAVASKQLAHFRMKAPFGNSRYLTILTPEYRDISSSEWFYKAASHYDRGISCLRTFLRRYSLGGDPASSFNPLAIASPRAASHATIRHLSGRGGVRKGSADNGLQDLISAISVFSLYESCDNASAGDSQHLNGFQSLIQGKRDWSGPDLSVFASRTGGRAAFWNFVLEDVLSAYANSRSTRLHSMDLGLWVAAGLPLVRRQAETSNAGEGSPTFQLDAIFDLGRDDVIAYALLWIANRVVNLITPSSDPQIGEVVFRTWTELRSLLDVWHKSLPVTFQPYATVETRNNSDLSQSDQETMFFSLPMNAGALQLYHFVQILLILHKPSDSEGQKSQTQRMRSLRKAAEESEYHSRCICGIALGNPPSAVQRLMVQSLHLAGSFFDTDEDRMLVLELLNGVETETGSSTARVRQDLLSQWARTGDDD